MQLQTIRDVFVACRRKLKKSCALGVCKVTLLAIWLSTWKERNDWIFEGKAWTIQNFNHYFLRTLYSWSQVLDDGTNLTF